MFQVKVCLQLQWELMHLFSKVIYWRLFDLLEWTNLENEQNSCHWSHSSCRAGIHLPVRNQTFYLCQKELHILVIIFCELSTIISISIVIPKVVIRAALRQRLTETLKLGPAFCHCYLKNSMWWLSAFSAFNSEQLRKSINIRWRNHGFSYEHMFGSLGFVD